MEKISYNNLIDLDSGLRCLTEFNEPTSIIIKHTDPVVLHLQKNWNCFLRSYRSDPKSAFGGIIFLNRDKLLLAKKFLKIFSKWLCQILIKCI